MSAFKKGSPGCCGCPSIVTTTPCGTHPIPTVLHVTDPLGNTFTLNYDSASQEWGGSAGVGVTFNSDIVASATTGCAQVSAVAKVYYRMFCSGGVVQLQQNANLYFCPAPSRYLNAKYPDMWTNETTNFVFNWSPAAGISYTPFAASYVVPVNAAFPNPNAPTPLSGTYTVTQ